MEGASGKVVRIGGASAFWGDSPTGAWQLVGSEGSNLHYLVADYLAEVTMAILARQNKEGGGFVGEFVQSVWKPLMKQILANKTKVVTNAGGMNPVACKAAIEQAARDAGLPVPVVAAVAGDDLMPRYEELSAKSAFTTFEEVPGEAEPKWHERGKLMSFNAYHGARAIAEALDRGAQIVVTGRCADSALVLGPLVHEFRWTWADHDLLSSGSLAGHIIECGCQATGGNFTDWELSLAGGVDGVESGRGWDNVGFPVVECRADGSFVVTKPKGTGGVVTTATVGEQMLYEIHNPAAYILPDVVCNWEQVRMKQVGPNRVLVHGARGLPPTPFLKISATSVDGWKIGGTLFIGGIDARKKALAVADAILARTRRILSMRGLPDFIRTHAEVLGAESSYGPHARPEVMATREVMLHITVHHAEPTALGLFAREVAPAATAMAPGISGGGTGRPRPQPLIHHSAVLVSRKEVPASLFVGDQPETRVPSTFEGPYSTSFPSPYTSTSGGAAAPFAFPTGVEMVEVPLVRLCYGRSGDKGDVANIGIIARNPAHYPFLRSALTEEVVHRYLAHLVKGTTRRFEVPGISGLNFVLTQALGGGGLASLHMDRQGKAYAQILLSLPVTVPRQWLAATDSPARL